MIKHRFIEKATKRPKIPVLENQIHTAIARYLDTVIKRPSRWHTVEVSNQAKGKAAMLRQVALKRKGVRIGWPDIEIIWRSPLKLVSMDLSGAQMSGGLQLIFLEVKIPGGKLTDKQEVLHQELREDGHHVSVVYSVSDVESILKELGVI